MFICLKAIFQSLPCTTTTTPLLLLLDQNLSDVSLSRDTNGIYQAFQWGFFEAQKNLSPVQFSWPVTGKIVLFLGCATLAVSCWRNPVLLKSHTAKSIDLNQFGRLWSSNSSDVGGWMMGKFFFTTLGMSKLRNERIFWLHKDPCCAFKAQLLEDFSYPPRIHVW